MGKELENTDLVVSAVRDDCALNAGDLLGLGAGCAVKDGLRDGEADLLSELAVDCERGVRVGGNRHGRGVSTVEQDVGSHIAGLHAERVVVNAVGSNAENGVHTVFAADDGQRLLRGRLAAGKGKYSDKQHRASKRKRQNLLRVHSEFLQRIK